jgi:murein endopeptidase
VFLLLTLVTQVGGIIYLISILLIRNKKKQGLKRLGLFITLYAVSVFIVIPNFAKLFGRQQIEDNANLESHSFIYKITNRTYVKPELNDVLVDLSKKIKVLDKNLKIIYLDANFPFFESFPLLPHLSHDDGEKVDITLMYENPQGKITNKKKSISGYGVFENPYQSEINQNEICKSKNFLYDFSKYLSLGKINSELVFSAKGTKVLVENIIDNSKINKIFIEPHLKQRLDLNHSKIRFHGCQAVRHDDHIHIQL